jgi:hypothetical protein
MPHEARRAWLRTPEGNEWQRRRVEVPPEREVHSGDCLWPMSATPWLGWRFFAVAPGPLRLASPMDLRVWDPEVPNVAPGGSYGHLSLDTNLDYKAQVMRRTPSDRYVHCLTAFWGNVRLSTDERADAIVIASHAFPLRIDVAVGLDADELAALARDYDLRIGERVAAACPCHDCGLDTAAADEFYMLGHSLWRGVASGVDFLCVGCVELRLGRRLVRDDFSDVPLNWLADVRRSRRLTNRLAS